MPGDSDSMGSETSDRLQAAQPLKRRARQWGLIFRFCRLIKRPATGYRGCFSHLKLIAARACVGQLQVSPESSADPV